jgi:hypothetical protein
MEVVDPKLSKPQDFGYVAFAINIVHPLRIFTGKFFPIISIGHIEEIQLSDCLNQTNDAVVPRFAL